MVAVLFIIAGVCLVAAIFGFKAQAEAKEDMRTAVSAKVDFTETKVIKDESCYYHFAVDEGRQEVFCYSRGQRARFKYSDIVAAEIQVDGDTTVSNKSASLGGAIAGGLIAGGVGAVVGGSSLGKSTSKKEVTSVNVHILVRNSEVDSIDIQCLNAVEGKVKTDDIRYRYAYGNAQKIYDTLRLAMDKVKVETPQPQVVVQQKSNIEELKELAELKQQGLITDEEFAAMKAKILSK